MTTKAPKATQSRSQRTRESVLNSAEVLFAKHGFDGVSTRQISAHSGANLQAIHYHFGGKAGLFKAAFERRIQPINEARAERLRAYLESIGDKKPELEGIMRAFVMPYVEQDGLHGYEWTVVKRALAQSGFVADDEMGAFVTAQFDQTWRSFMAAFEKALHGVPVLEIHWRFYFAICTLYSTVGRNWLHEVTDGECDPSDPQALAEQLIPFLIRGMDKGSSNN